MDEEKEEKDFYAAAADCPVVPEMGAMGLIGWDDHPDESHNDDGNDDDDDGGGDGGDWINGTYRVRWLISDEDHDRDPNESDQ